MTDRALERGWLVPKLLLGAVVLFVLLDQVVPVVPLVFLSHDSVPRPDPTGEPIQEESGRAPFREWRRMKEFVLTPRASYDISALVLSTERYRFGAAGAILPWDFAVGWGEAVTQDVFGRISVSQFSRFYSWSTRDPSLDVRAVTRSSANVHLIAASRRIERGFARVRRGDVVRLEGDLVDIEGPDGFTWKTSLSRDDTGPGACETLYVRWLTVGSRRYR